MAKIISKLIKKVGTGYAKELILYLRKVVKKLIGARKGKELVEVFFEYASKEDRDYVIQYIHDSCNELISDSGTQ